VPFFLCGYRSWLVATTYLHDKACLVGALAKRGAIIDRANDCWRDEFGVLRNSFQFVRWNANNYALANDISWKESEPKRTWEPSFQTKNDFKLFGAEIKMVIETSFPGSIGDAWRNPIEAGKNETIEAGRIPDGADRPLSRHGDSGRSGRRRNRACTSPRRIVGVEHHCPSAG
jgi:hypothetical protein